MQRLLDALTFSVAKDKPVRTAELFDRVFSGWTVWRASDEPMAACVARREREFSELTRINPETTVSQDIQAHLLLRFSGLTWQQRSHKVSSAGRVYNIGKLNTAVCAQFPNIRASVSSSNRAQASGKGRG